jgi:ABC-type uncharacterized transport system substrate-binding protein
MLGSIHRHWGHCNEAARVHRGLDWRHGNWVAISGIAQQPDRLRQIGALLIGAGPLSDEFARQLERLGWIEGHNIHIEMRTHSGDSDRMRAYAGELARLSPDVILAASPVEAKMLQQETGKIPIVFASGTDPVGQGAVDS